MEAISKADILMHIRSEFDGLHRTIQIIPRADLEAPGVEGEWSVKDILCHLSTWRRLCMEWTQDLLAGKAPDRPAPDESWETLDDFNQTLYLEKRAVPLGQALDEFVRAHTDSLALVEGLAESDLIDPERFAWRKGDPLWHMVAGNTWLHDKEHHETIQRWLESKGG